MDDKFKLIVSIVLLIVTIVFFIWTAYEIIIFNSNKVYCKHYCKKEWNLWEKIIKKLKEQKGIIYISKYDDHPVLNSFKIDIEIDSEKYKLIYWVKEGFVSVYQGTNCTLCSYDKHHSNMAIKIIREKIKELFNDSDEKVKQMTKELIGE